MEIVIKRAYDAADQHDGYRVLVDRLWPRGIKKEVLKLNEWDKDIAPSAELRTWFGHDPAKFKEFSTRYQKELAGSDEPKKLIDRAKGKRLTLVYSAKDSKHNQAVVLKQYLEKLI